MKISQWEKSQMSYLFARNIIEEKYPNSTGYNYFGNF